MSSPLIALVTVAVLLLFWAVGVYNRLMSLRNAVLRRFGRFDEQFGLRHALLLSHLDPPGASPPAAPSLGSASDECTALRAACLQVHGACELARSRPTVAETITSLRLAEEILQGAIARLQPLPQGESGHGELVSALSVCESALQFARGQFNDAVRDYNHAARQFPACLLAPMFGFRAAGQL